MVTLVLLLFGFLVGTIGTIVGVGGGIFIIPFLLITYHLSPQAAIGTSLLVILFNSTSGTVSYSIQKRINYKLGIVFGLATIPGVLLGAAASKVFTMDIFRIVFAAVLIIVAVYLILKKEPAGTEQDNPTSQHSLIYLPIVFITGFIAGFLGIGGGIVHLPVLIVLMRLPVHQATATSHFILVITSIVAVLAHGLLENVKYDIGLWLGLGSIFGAQLGAYLSRHIKAKMIIFIISSLLILTALRLLLA
ncbi:MAG: sulfite exporter TauE/SafE family protein [Planctomycetes bacterium]|nr:sulfite exporter TauE/SafE family protein [Planctomycetota bacterium]